MAQALTSDKLPDLIVSKLSLLVSLALNVTLISNSGLGAEDNLPPANRRKDPHPVPIIQDFISIGMNPIQEYQLDGISGNTKLFQKFPDLGSLTGLHSPRIPPGFIRHITC
jgi:hypothetical protein